MSAFVYCWTDHKTNKLYVGSHAGSVDDGYICSSKYMLSEYSKRPNDFTRQIVATGDIKDIRKFETKLLKAFNAKSDELFYNRCNADGLIGFATGSKNPMKNAASFEKMITKKRKTMVSKFGVDHYWKTKEHSEMMSSRISKLNVTQVTCPVCDKTGGYVNMKRYHFNNCKKRK